MRSYHQHLGRTTDPAIRSQHDVDSIPRTPRQHRLVPPGSWRGSAYYWGNGEVDRWVPATRVNLPLPESPRHFPSPIRERSLSDAGWGSDDGARGKENDALMDTTPMPDTDATVSID